MQPDHEADDLQALLHEEYGASRLDNQFSADLMARLQAEAVRSTTPTSMSVKPRRFPLATCLAIAPIAAIILVVIWLNRAAPLTNHEVARRDKSKSDGAAQLHLTLSRESKSERVDHMSESLRSMSLSPESEKEEWPNMSATVALADMLYVVDSGHLYEVNTSDGSRRKVGDADWRNTAAMGSAVGRLYIVSDNQLYEVNSKTGARRSLGKPEWVNTTAILTVGDKLYIASNGLLHRVNPSDGSHEVLHSKSNNPNQPRQPKQ